ncbi:MAG: hypothetical protein VB049_08355 [Candidatus Pelethousia sp.]|nr:hypothetical protein [Candidatus Pelethousia sp.]
MGKAEIREIRTLTKQIWKSFPANSEPVRLLEAILKICEYLDSRPTMERCAEVEEACGAEDSHVTNVAMLIPSLKGLKEEMEKGFVGPTTPTGEGQYDPEYRKEFEGTVGKLLGRTIDILKSLE